MPAKRRRRAAQGCVAILLAGVVGFNVYEHLRPRTVFMTASWAESYSTFQELNAHSDVAVAGTISSLIQAYTDPSTGIQYSDFGFTVNAVLSDPRHLLTGVGSIVTIHQTGGTAGGVTFEEQDDPLFAVGSRYVLFLREYEPGHFFVVGGPNGRYFWGTGGTVSPINNEGIQGQTSLSGLSSTLATP